MNGIDIAIYGTGGAAKGFHWHLNHEAAEIRDPSGQARKPNVIGYLDDDATMHGRKLHGLPVLGGMEWVSANPGAAVVVGIGIASDRERVTTRLIGAGAWIPTFISPDARIAMGCMVGKGCFVYSGAIVNVDAALGDHCFLNMNVTIGHDSHIGDFTVAYPGASVSGGVTVGRGVSLGANSAVIQDVAIGDYASLGALSCAIEDIPARATAVGVPARVIREAPREPDDRS